MRGIKVVLAVAVVLFVGAPAAVAHTTTFPTTFAFLDDLAGPAGEILIAGMID